MWPYIIPGFIIGFAGSLHCVGMCGPLALAIPSGTKSQKHLIINSLKYNFGRSFTYALLGLMFGWLGNGFFIAGFQQWISIASGIIILIVWLSGNTRWFKIDFLNGLIRHLQRSLNKLILGPFRSSSSLFIGMLNGLLPCGLVYVAVVASLATGSALAGATMMFSFGLGTIPLMVALMVFGRKINLSFRMKLSRIVPVFVLCISILLILRGLNLGIPFVSPELNVEGTTPKMEHCK